MKAVILAAGFSTKLEPLTNFISPAMLPLGNKPVMQHIVEWLAENRIKEVIITTHILADQIETHFGGGQRWGLHISYSLENQDLGDAGSLRRLTGAADSTLLVIQGDHLPNLDLEAMIETHHRVKAMVTAAVVPASEGSDKSEFYLDSGGSLRNQPDSAHNENIVSAVECLPIFLVEPEVLGNISSGKKTDMRHDLLPYLIKKGVQTGGFLCSWDQGNVEGVENFQRAQSMLLSGSIQQATPAGRLNTGKMWFGRNVSIHPSAKIIEPVCLGDHCRIEAQVVIGPNVVLGPGVFVDQGTTIANSTVLEKTYLGRLVNIQDALVYRNILIKTDTGASAFIPDRFLLSGIEPGAWMEGLRRVLELFFALLLILVMLPLFLFSAVLSLLSRPKSWIVYEERLSSTMAELDASSLREPRAVRLPRFGCNPDNAPGKLLHRLGWDGLPMLFSIFQGHIALVGVGPLRPEQYAQVTEEWQRQRFLSLAGLTGLWYITSGSQASLDEQFVVDCYYAVTRNWKIDLDILWKTIPTWWRRVTA